MTDKPYILIVDDKEENLIALEKILQEVDVTIVRALSGNEALAKTLEYDFAIALIDVKMPGMDGFETVQLMRQVKKTRLLPVIFLSAIYTHDDYLVNGIEIGAVDFLSKPYMPQRLMNKVNVFLELYKQRKMVEQANVLLQKEILERKRIEQTTIQLNEELKRSNRDLEEFTYVVSHDLKEPLRKIITYSEFLFEDHEDELDDSAKNYIIKMRNSANWMHGLINNLLDLSRVGTRGRNLVQVDANRILVHILDMMQFKSGDEKNGFTDPDGNFIHIDLLPHVWADEIQIQQVFQNLISNGIKYQKENNIAKIHVTSEDEGEWIKFSIQDNGIGFERRFHDKIFKIFQRLHPREKYSGTGIGLAICKKIIERHGGKIWCDSQVDIGSTFYFTLRKADQV